MAVPIGVSDNHELCKFARIGYINMVHTMRCNCDSNATRENPRLVLVRETIAKLTQQKCEHENFQPRVSFFLCCSCTQLQMFLDHTWWKNVCHLYTSDYNTHQKIRYNAFEHDERYLQLL